MKYSSIILIFFLFPKNQFSQNTPTYPETKDYLKRIDFILPKIKNPNDYKVEISFSFEFETIECSNTVFMINVSDIEKGYGLDTRYPYYIFDAVESEIVEGFDSDCDKSKPKIKRKIYSYYKTIENYPQSYPIPYYIPKYWNLEYRIFKAEENFKAFE